MRKFCLICTPRSGSFYVQNYISKIFELEFGSEWFGRVKRVEYKGMKTTSVDIDHSVNEDLLTNEEMSKRLVYLKNYENPFIIKCMPFQLSNTIERKDLPDKEKMEIATKIMKNFDLIYMETKDKVSQFCFDVISKKQDYIKRNFTSYNPDIRQIPLENSMTATRENYESFCERQDFVDKFKEKNWKGEPIIVWENFIKSPNVEMTKIKAWYNIDGHYGRNHRPIIPHAVYRHVFTNYEEIEKWFG